MADREDTPVPGESIVMNDKSKRTAFLDGCHRYGWLIAPIITLLGAALMLAYSTGVMQQDLNSLHEQVRDGFTAVSQRITRNENLIDGIRARMK